jgi:hypothetical protein
MRMYTFEFTQAAVIRTGNGMQAVVVHVVSVELVLMIGLVMPLICIHRHRAPKERYCQRQSKNAF